jgi:hypothetical protein
MNKSKNILKFKFNKIIVTEINHLSKNNILDVIKFNSLMDEREKLLLQNMEKKINESIDKREKIMLLKINKIISRALF